jgi:ABC-type antimicrobial peptide transport system permease subunit
VPKSWAEKLGARPGAAIDLEPPGSEARQRQKLSGKIVGVLAEGFYLARYPITTLETLKQLRMVEEPNVLLMRWSPDTSARAGVASLDRLLDPLQILTTSTPRERAGELVGGLFSPVKLIMVVVFGFSALGVLNVMLLSFLQRKRQFGILKALGAEDGELQIMLLLEGFLMTLAGVAGGLVVCVGAVFVLNYLTVESYVMNPLAVASGIVLSCAVFYLGAWLPVNMLQRATVDELLRYRRLV